MTASTLTPDWLNELLAQPAAAARAACLRAAGLWSAAGLGQVLDEAMRQARSDPGRARQLAGVVAEAAAPAGAPELFPRAAYLQAQTHALNGEFSQALALIQTVRAAYEALGEPLEALRTNIGRMHVLNELGQHADALQAGQEVLEALAQPGEPNPPAQLLIALTHMNRGVVFETTGRYDEALAAYAEAEAQFTLLGQTERVAEVANNRAIVLVHIGRVGEALSALRSAAGTWAAAGLVLRQAQTLSNIGDAHLSLSQFTEALQAFEEARRLSEPLEAVAHKGILRRKTADAYLALNLLPEAVTAYREAIGLLQQAGMADHHARACWGLGVALAALDQPPSDEAARALAQAAAMFADAGNTPMLCTVRLEQAALHAAHGDQAAALDLAQEAARLADPARWPVQALYASLRLADLQADPAEAEPHVHNAQRLADAFRLPLIDYRVESRLGRLRRAQGRLADARQHLERAVAQLETLRGSLALESLRTSFLRDKTAPYADLIELHLADEAVAAAFAVAERAKSRSLVDLAAGLLSPQPDGVDPALAEQLRQRQADLSAAYSLILEAPAAEWERLRARVARLEGEISQLRLRLPAVASMADQSAAPMDLAALRASLPDGLRLVAYHTLGDEILAFLVGPDSLQVKRGLSTQGTVAQLLQRLNTQWDRFRAGADFAHKHSAQLEQSTQRSLQTLHAALVAPLEAWLAAPGTNQLAIVPHGLLHQVPFHALFDGQRYLLDRFVVSYAPSATVLALCQRQTPSTPAHALVVGVADALIPAAQAEAEQVTAQLAHAGLAVTTLTGADATLDALTRLAPSADVLHLACHGLFRGDNPMFSALKLHDGWLTAADALQLPLAGAVVALSACESGRSTVVPGDEAIGLPRAFLGAGAASVLVSLWLVSDATTATLMAAWYGALRQGQPWAEALRAAQRAVREQHPHPYYWAPFVLAGRR